MKSYTGKTLEEVLAKAAAEKGVAVEDLTHYVTETKAGFLGIGASVTAEIYAQTDVVSFVEEYLTTFFTGLGLNVEVDVRMKDNSVVVNLNSDNNAMLIGRNGTSLTGMNVLVRNVVNARFKRRFFVSVDVNGYKMQRYNKLRYMAKRIAKTVLRTGVTATLDPMPGDERRVIHKELSEIPNIKTQSEGEGKLRHLTVMYVENKE